MASAAGNSNAGAKELSCDHNKEIRQLWIHVKTLYALLVGVSLATIVAFLLYFGELQKLQKTNTVVASARQQKTTTGAQDFARHDEPKNRNSSANYQSASFAEDPSLSEEDDDEEDFSSQFLSNKSSDDQFRKRSNYFRRHLPSANDHGDFIGARSPVPSSVYGTLKEDESAERSSSVDSVDGKKVDRDDDDNWVWLTSYSRIPVSCITVSLVLHKSQSNH